jgi:hypothetical protein
MRRETLDRASVVGAVVTETSSGTLHVVLPDGQEVWIHPRQAAVLVAALLAQGRVHHEWLHGGGR